MMGMGWAGGSPRSVIILKKRRKTVPKTAIILPMAGFKCCKTYFHNFTQVAMNQIPATGQM